MTSPYLERPLRRRAEMLEDILTYNAGTYVVVGLSRDGEPYAPETDIGQTFNQVVTGLADGQYQKAIPNTPLAVIRFSCRDNEAEIVTQKVAEAVAERVLEDWRHEREIPLSEIECPFLDEVWPGWRQEGRRAA